jgi:hypothetical protein
VISIQWCRKNPRPRHYECGATIRLRAPDPTTLKVAIEAVHKFVCAGFRAMAEGKFISYLRVSTDKQGRSGLGIEAQREAVASYLNGGRWTHSCP